jgi:hypothetical protein
VIKRNRTPLKYVFNTLFISMLRLLLKQTAAESLPPYSCLIKRKSIKLEDEFNGLNCRKYKIKET